MPSDSRRHFAHKNKKLDREGRLLWFALEEPHESAGETPEVGGSSVEDIAKGTRGKTEQAITGEEGKSSETGEAKISNEKILESVQKMRDKIEDEHKSIQDAEEIAKEKLKGKDRAEYLKILKEFNNVLGISSVNFIKHEEVMTMLSDWDEGSVSPHVMRKFLADDVLDGQGNEILSDFDSFLANYPNKNVVNSWDQATPEEKAEFVKAASEVLPNKDIAELIKNDVEALKESIDEMQKAYAAVDQLPKDDGKGTSFWFFNVRFYSINDLYNAGKSVVEAWHKGYQERTELKSSGLAQKAGKILGWLPWGKDANIILNRELEGKNDEVKESYKKFLETRNLPFKNIEEMLEKNQNDGNRFRAVLEYAADRGWLYDFDTNTGTVFKKFSLTMGETVPDTWTDDNLHNYIRTLDEQNSQGQTKMKDQGYSRVETYEDIPPIIEVLEDELERGNYWAAHGIQKRAMEKGKQGEVSTWFAVTICRHLRENATARKYFPTDLLDDMGNIGIQHPAWTTTYFKANRKKFAAWKQKYANVKDATNFEDCGELASIVMQVEGDIKRTGVSLTQSQLDRYVAKVLATQTVNIQGHVFSIYDDKYSWYRDNYRDKATTIKVDQADDDFFGLQSEILLLGQEGIDSILYIETNGEFKHNVKAFSFFEQIFKRAESLKKPGLEKDLSNFKYEMQTVLNNYFRRKVGHGPTKELWKARTRRGTQTLLLNELKRQELISPDVYNSFFSSEPEK